VVDYKHEHNIVETVGGPLIDDQRLTDIKSEVENEGDGWQKGPQVATLQERWDGG
jgi:hypothetical protein